MIPQPKRGGSTWTWVLGVVGVLFVTVFWALTGRIEPVLVGLFGSCIGLNEGVSAIRELARTAPKREDGTGDS